MPLIRKEGGQRMISVRQLGKHASVIMAELADDGGPLIVTRDGVPFAQLVLLSEATEASSAPLTGGQKQAGARVAAGREC